MRSIERHPDPFDSLDVSLADVLRGTEIAWAAGFFDSEGHVGSTSDGYIRLTISQKRIEPLDRFRAALGQGGKIHVVYQRRLTLDGLNDFSEEEKVHMIHVYNIAAQVKVVCALDLMWPYLTLPKVEQALAAGYVPSNERAGY